MNEKKDRCFSTAELIFVLAILAVLIAELVWIVSHNPTAL
jgi:heme/copper-type cytochrome/quinol oxidase subunit 4